jgi:mannose-6-phosphate isomerase-like protein (cupin superfamily)
LHGTRFMDVHPLVNSTQRLDILGVTLEFLTPPSATRDAYCVLEGRIPAGASVPLHSHPDPESFFVLSGVAQVLLERDGQLEWIDVKPGDYVHILAHMKHAHRVLSSEPVTEIVTTTAPLGRFFLEVGRPIQSGVRPAPPSVEEVEHFESISRRYGHWMATPAENAAVGIKV